MYKYITILSFLAVLFVSCGQVETVIVELPALRSSTIYNDDSVYTYMKTFGDAHRQAAETYLKKGLELAGSNAKRAIYNIKRAITLYPTQAAYQQLGKLFSAERQYGEARRTYGMLAMKGYIR